MNKMIYVFKTNVRDFFSINFLEPHLNRIIGKSNWNFDLEDCDKILRVESENVNKLDIVAILNSLNFECEELPD